MNLLNLKTKLWDQKISQIINLKNPNTTLSGPPINPNTIFSNIAPFFQKSKFNFSNSCKIIPFTGDNPSALIGVGAVEPNTCVVSLGTSDTIFVNLKGLPENSKEAHIFCSPLGDDDDEYMALCCYRNGSLIREEILEQFGPNKISWDEVSQILQKPQKSWLDNNLFSVYFKLQEITPNLGPNFIRFFENFQVISDPNLSFEKRIFAVITGQILAKRAHLEKFLNIKNENLKKIIVTGGASKNLGILKLFSNIFQADIYSLVGNTEAAAFGGCIRAKYALTSELVRPEEVLVVSPDESLKEYYCNFVERYKELEENNFSSL